MNFFILLILPPGFSKFKLVITHTTNQRAQLEFGMASGVSKDDKGRKKHIERRKKRKEGRGGRKAGMQG